MNIPKHHKGFKQKHISQSSPFGNLSAHRPMQMPGKTVWSLSIEQEEVLSKMVDFTQNISYPFGMHMPERSFSSGSYRYGFQGQEKDDEIKGDGNSINYKYRVHDPRLGRFLSFDPLAPDYPWNSPYAFSENRVIDARELEGLERLLLSEINQDTKTAKLKIVKNIYLIKQQHSIPDHLLLDPSKIKRNFELANTVIYLNSLPENFNELDIGRRRDWRNGTAYAVEIEYEVNTFVVDGESFNELESKDDRGLSTIVTTANSDFEDSENVRGKNIGAQASTSQQLTDRNGNSLNFENVLLNPGYEGNLTIESIITHEVGAHNMASIKHSLDQEGKPIYPTYGVESNTNNPTPTKQETKRIINNNLNRGNLDKE
jgi:RHS repeat-associated protein